MPQFKPLLPKLRGQHFLSDPCVLAKIAAASEINPGETVLEVGPGAGALTRELLPLCRRLVAVELDPSLAQALREEFGSAKNLEIVQGDILKLRIADLLGGAGYALVSNLPYNITSAFLKKFLTGEPLPRVMVVMVQEEVADRIAVGGAASRGSRAASPISMLGLMCSLYAECEKLFTVPAGAFVPSPKVSSAVIKARPYPPDEFEAKWDIGRESAEDVLSFAGKFFANPRKKMAGALGKGHSEALKNALREIGEDPDSRPAVLPVGKWVELWKRMR